MHASAIVGCDCVDLKGKTLGTVVGLVVEITPGGIAYPMVTGGGDGQGEVRCALH